MAEDPHQDEEPDVERATRNMGRRQHEQTETVERVLDRADEMLGEHKYPVTSEELATEYADEYIDLPNETESLGSVFDRIVDERFESKQEAREALVGEITGEAGPADEFNDGRDLDDLDDASQEGVTDSGASDM